MHIAEDADMAIGVTDPHGTLLWTWSSTPMRSSADKSTLLKVGNGLLSGFKMQLVLHSIHIQQAVFIHMKTR